MDLHAHNMGPEGVVSFKAKPIEPYRTYPANVL
jgi:hypothetical protein